MTQKRRPFWLYVAAVPFVSYALIACWLLAFGPRPHGISSMRCGEEHCEVLRVVAGSAAEAAGLLPGDTLLSLNGQAVPASWRVWRTIDRLWIGRHTLGIARGAEKRELSLDLGRRSLRHWRTVAGLSELSTALTGLLTLGLGLVVVVVRPWDASARLGALFLTTLGVAEFTFGFWVPSGFSHLVAALPLPVALLPILGFTLASAFMHESSLAWACSFPRPLFKSRWIWALLWLPAVVRVPTSLISRLAGDLPALGLPVDSVPGEAVIDPVLLFLRGVYTLGVPCALFWSYRQVEAVNERRRLRVVLVGLAVSFLAILVHYLLGFLPMALYGTAPAYLDSAGALIVRALVLVLPLSMTLAILRHRLFDIRLIIRRGLQYAAARHLLLSLTPICGALLIFDLALRGDEPIGRILGERGWLYALLGVTGWVLHARRRSWLEGLDRRFFRERYDARRLLVGVVEEIRSAASLKRVAEGVTQRIAAALHPEHATILLRSPDQADFLPVAAASSVPQAAALGSLPAQGKLVALLRVIGKPVEVPLRDSGWLGRQLPADEVQTLRQARIEWVFPLGLGAGKTEGLLALGPKLSEEPYSEEDQELLNAIAASLTLLLDRGSGAPSARPGVSVADAPTAALLAPPSGAAVEKIAGRYRLGPLLGRGGMGAVLEATDLTLDRTVALKVMRPELALDPQATERFKREARAAAAFTHPNVVTVHDFGVDTTGVAYLVMERLVGETVRAALLREGRWPTSRVLRVLGAVASAVDAAHEQHLVHRDLKPENVFLVRVKDQEVPKVLDFGIAKSYGAAGDTAALGGTAPGVLVGTPKYMSPEQLQGGEASPAWDLWALGVLAYEVLTGAPPFPSPTTGSGQEAIRAGRAASTRATFGESAAVWDALFAQLFASDPARRPNSARALVAALTAAAERTA